MDRTRAPSRSCQCAPRCRVQCTRGLEHVSAFSPQTNAEDRGERRRDIAHIDLAKRPAGRDTLASNEERRAHVREISQVSVHSAHGARGDERPSRCDAGHEARLERHQERGGRISAERIQFATVEDARNPVR